MAAVLSQLPPFIIVTAYALFWAWEVVSSARPRPGAEPPFRRIRNLGVTVLTIAISAATGAGLLFLSALAEARHWGLLAYVHPAAWAAVAVGILALDIADYWRHRISHFVPVLWRLHRLHHSDPVMDVTTSFRSHPIEFLIRGALFGSVVLVVGVPPLSLLLMPVLQLPILLFQHANVRLPVAFDRTLAFIVATPRMHLVHHSRHAPQTNSNYATFLTIWDRLFGSFRPSVAPDAIGLDGHDGPHYQTLAGMLLTPWR